MKRIALALMVIALALCLIACGNETLPTGSQPTQNTQQAGNTVPSTQPTTVVTQPTEPAHIHEWSEATCIFAKTCKTCAETEGEALGHNWQAATCTAPKTCKTCGATEGSAKGHDWSDATCTEPKACKTCGATEGSAKGHDWSVATCTEPKACKTCGATEGAALGHNWAPMTCTEPMTCRTCGATGGTAKGHDWSDATCTEPKTCKTCGATEGTAKGHDYIDGYCCICNSQASLLLFDGNSFIAYADDLNTIFDLMTNTNGEYVIKLADGIMIIHLTLNREEWPECKSIRFACENGSQPFLFIYNKFEEYKLRSDLIIEDLNISFASSNKTGSAAVTMNTLDLNGHDLTIDSTFLDFCADIYNSSAEDSTIYTYATYNENHENYVDGGPWLYGNIECENFVAYGFVRTFGSVTVNYLEAHKQIALQANDERAIDCNIDIDRFIVHNDLNFKGVYFDSIQIHSLINESNNKVKIHIQGMDLSESTFYINNIEGNNDVVFYYATYEVVVSWNITVGGDMDFDFSQNPDGTYTVYYPLKNGDCFIKTGTSDLDVTVYVINEDGSGEQLQLPYENDGYYYLEQEAHETIESAAKNLRAGMVGRKSKIYVELVHKESLDASTCQNIFDCAIDHTGVPSEGNVIMWQFESCSWSYSYWSNGNRRNHITVRYNPLYYTTKEQ